MTQINIMALRHSAFYSPLLMTMAGGFLRQQGLDYHYAVATPDNTVPDSIASGRCHLAQSAVATRLLELELGVASDIVHFAQINVRDGFFLAARQADAAFEWRRLEGRRVLVDHFFQPLAMFRYALYRQGVNEAAIEFVDAGDVAAMDRAFRAGQGDFVHQQGPAPQQLEHEGVGYVVASVGEAVGPVAFSSLCASRAWCESEMAGAFMRAYQQALAYVIAAPAADIARQQQAAGFFPEITPEVLARTIADYQALGCWQPETAIAEDAFENLLEVFLYNQKISRRYAYDEIVVRLG